MSPRVYVGGLSVCTTDHQLAELSATYGTVKSTCVIRSTITDESFGFGFVEMGSATEARNMITALDGAQLKGQRLRVFYVPLNPPR
jgi:RNA recognition motif-containing protein